MGELIVFVFILCVLGHFMADYTLQGCLANMKQKRWGDAQLAKSAVDSTEKYRNDYKAGLVCHGLYWAIVTFLPLFLFGIGAYVVGILMLVNASIHYRVDDEKANKLSINLIEDQLLHLGQIIVTIVVASINCWR